jgi:hypothetical protein
MRQVNRRSAADGPVTAGVHPSSPQSSGEENGRYEPAPEQYAHVDLTQVRDPRVAAIWDVHNAH